ncbi:MAG: hypothetical protein IT445_09425 [Phycisphaeraceae bacterium]|nr:hypothetical protein [Phycisphaeraceae bacterium]
MDSVQAQLTALVLAVLIYALVLAVLRVLGARVRLTLARHDLLVESKRRRLEFERQLAAMRRAEAEAQQQESDVIVEDEIEPEPEPMPMRRAA